MDPKLQDLKSRYTEVYDLQMAAQLLHWDQTTYMPPGGASARGRQVALLTRLAHEKQTDPAIGKLLDELKSYEESLPYEHDDAAMLRVSRRFYEKAVKVPASFAARQAEQQAAMTIAWQKARPANDFSAVLPYLEKNVELCREYSNFFPGYAHIADPLIDQRDYGVTVGMLRPLFASLRDQLVPLVQAITAQSPADDSCVRQFFPADKQLAAGLDIIKQFGYDFNRGREDKSAHPYTTKFSIGDVRITTRVNERDLRQSLFATMHESGHGMYEQGLNPDYEGTILARGTSSGVHESQSRTWENLVGRSRIFWEYYYPQLQSAFPEQLGSVPLDAFYRAVNKVQRSLIRTEADEVTYNLHIIIRFDIECDLLEGKLAVKDLPEYWRSRYQSDLGISPIDDKDGCLQDTHWFSGNVGGVFQGYTLGNILGAQFFQAALKARPQIPDDIKRGEFSPLHGWLKENLYRHGRKFTAAETVERLTGSPMSIDPYIAYLKRKFGELYSL
jgi:carboxypeptidase Taq